MTFARRFVLAAGGTGGHMIPAHALAQALIARGHGVTLVTDERGMRFPGLFEGVDVQVMPAGRLGGGMLGMLRAARNIWAGRRMAKRLYREIEPAAVVGFGGYPALPALLAAGSVPTAIHEQNAVLGRTNRFLAGRVEAIATAYTEVRRIKRSWVGKVELVGNPVRGEVLALRDRAAPRLDDGQPFRVLVTGGSQGATILSRVTPDGLGLLPAALRTRLQVTHQARPEDLETARARYADLGIAAECVTYLADLPARLGTTHLVIGRAGASTIAELTAAGRAAVLVPYAAAMDDHQTWNAQEMADAGGARVIPEGGFTARVLADAVVALAATPDTLAEAAALARAAGRPDAAERLADLVERLARTPNMDPMTLAPPAGGTPQLKAATA